MKRKIVVGDAIEYICNETPIIGHIGCIDEYKKEYGVYVTSVYSMRKCDIAMDYISFDDVIAIYKKIEVKTNESAVAQEIRSMNKTTITDWRNLC